MYEVEMLRGSEVKSFFSASKLLIFLSSSPLSIAPCLSTLVSFSFDLPAIFTYKFNEPAPSHVVLFYPGLSLPYPDQGLHEFSTYRDKKPSSDLQLVHERPWYVRGSCCYNDCIEWGFILPSECSVTDLYHHVAVTEFVQHLSGSIGKRGYPFNTVYLMA